VYLSPTEVGYNLQISEERRIFGIIGRGNGLLLVDVVCLVYLCCDFFVEFKLGPEEVERWFTKIDHIFEHTRIPPVGEILAPFYKIAVDRTQRHHLPLVSHVNHKLVQPFKHFFIL
jgi:hypothetical protein